MPPRERQLHLADPARGEVAVVQARYGVPRGQGRRTGRPDKRRAAAPDAPLRDVHRAQGALTRIGTVARWPVSLFATMVATTSA